MFMLPIVHPEVHQYLMNGSLSLQHSDNHHPLGHIPLNQTIEVTVNKTQTACGTTKFNYKSGAVMKYYITAEHRSAFLGHLKDVVQDTKSDFNHAKPNEPRIEKNENVVSEDVHLFKSWVNPFAGEQDLVSISTACAAPPETCLKAPNII